jgi:hypothetical protein
MNKTLHLDSVYRNRWIEFHLENRKIEDSRKINWRNVEWEKVDKIIVKMCGEVHHFDKQNKENFKCFMNFRWSGEDWLKGKKFTIDIWTIGWTDGVWCYLTDINFTTGKIVNYYKAPLKEFKAHIHPRIKL